MATIVRAVIGYVILLFVVRALTRRPGSQMTLFEFVFVFLVGGIIILATVGPDRSVTNCTCAVITVALMHRTVSFMKSRSPRFGAVVDGTPLVVYRKGEFVDEVMHGMLLRREDVLAAARTQGVTSLEQVEYAILERNGRISIIRREC